MKSIRPAGPIPRALALVALDVSACACSGRAAETGIPGVPPGSNGTPDDWPAASRDYANSRSTTHSTIDASNVATLTPAWQAPIPGRGSSGNITTTTPSSRGHDLPGSERQRLGLDRETGTVRWRTDLLKFAIRSERCTRSARANSRLRRQVREGRGRSTRRLRRGRYWTLNLNRTHRPKSTSSRSRTAAKYSISSVPVSERDLQQRPQYAVRVARRHRRHGVVVRPRSRPDLWGIGAQLRRRVVSVHRRSTRCAATRLLGDRRSRSLRERRVSQWRKAARSRTCTRTRWSLLDVRNRRARLVRAGRTTRLRPIILSLLVDVGVGRDAPHRRSRPAGWKRDQPRRRDRSHVVDRRSESHRNDDPHLADGSDGLPGTYGVSASRIWRRTGIVYVATLRRRNVLRPP